jgi:hypothetical protein
MMQKSFYAFTIIFILQTFFFSSESYPQERSYIENIFFEKTEYKDIVSIELQKKNRNKFFYP